MTATKRPGPGTLGLDDNEQEWVAAKWREIRRAQALADAANNEWHRLNDEIKSYLDRSGVSDIKQRALIKSESLTLKDAFSVGEWHAANSQRHIDDLALFLRMKELGVL